MVVETVAIVVIALGGFAGGVLCLRAPSRRASEVLADLTEDETIETSSPTETLVLRTEARPEAPRSILGWSLLGGAAIIFAALSAGIPFKALPPLVLLVGAAAVFIGSRSKRVSTEEIDRDLLFYLPIAMERVVMAVQAGHDVLSALRVVSEEGKSSGHLDPATKIFASIYNQCERGRGLAEVIRDEIIRPYPIAVKHALIHLSIAYQQGGAVISSLRELSDSTQLFFQETIEEEIASLPAKATIPLLVTFAGVLIVLFAAPLVQFKHMAQQATASVMESR